MVPFLFLTLKNEEVPNSIPISIFFSKSEGHKFTEFACLYGRGGYAGHVTRII